MCKIRYFVIALFGLYLLCGCEDALTVKPENSLTYENGLSTPKDFESFINGIANKERGVRG